jgi:hypothetical protein
MKAYHGSYIKIDKIDLSKSEPRKDFGLGFYVANHHPGRNGVIRLLWYFTNIFFFK